MSWILTVSGKKLNFLDLQPDQICLEDIAIGLSNVPRFAAQLRTFYSVAEHCVKMFDLFEHETNKQIYFDDPDFEHNVRIAILLHDASEAYMCDVPRPLKALLPEYRNIEKSLSRVIGDKLGMSQHPYVQAKVTQMDNLCLKNEGYLRGLELNEGKFENIPILPNFKLSYWPPKVAYKQFLNRWQWAHN